MPGFAFLASKPRSPWPADTLPRSAVTITVNRATRAAVTPLAGDLHVKGKIKLLVGSVTLAYFGVRKAFLNRAQDKLTIKN